MSTEKLPMLKVDETNEIQSHELGQTTCCIVALTVWWAEGRRDQDMKSHKLEHAICCIVALTVTASVLVDQIQQLWTSQEMASATMRNITQKWYEFDPSTNSRTRHLQNNSGWSLLSCADLWALLFRSHSAVQYQRIPRLQGHDRPLHILARRNAD